MRDFNPIWPKIPLSEQSWRSQRKPDQKLCVEIGAGVGMHAIQFAGRSSDVFITAIERTEEKSTKMFRRVAAHQPLPNLYALRADAIEWIWQNIQSSEVDEYFILYPNPHPKPSQANQRWVNMPFFAYLLETLKPDGQITLATNIENYFNEACEVAQSQWGLEISARQLPMDYPARTHFEYKYLQRGERCYECVMHHRR